MLSYICDHCGKNFWKVKRIECHQSWEKVVNLDGRSCDTPQSFASAHLCPECYDIFKTNTWAFFNKIKED